MTGDGKPLRGKWTVRLAENLFQDYLILPPGIPFVAALWTIGTYIFEQFDCFPYLTVTCPVKRCGKTRFGEILELLCCRPMMTVNVSEAALFRTIDGEKPTVIIDEAESLRSRDSERSRYLLPILQAGFRQGAIVPRCVGKGHEVEKFSVYCPKAILAIGNLPDTLTDRSIVSFHATPSSKRACCAFSSSPCFTSGRRSRERHRSWADAYKEQISKAYLKQNLDFLRDREADIWEPLFAIASVAVPERLEELKQIAIRLSGPKARHGCGRLAGSASARRHPHNLRWNEAQIDPFNRTCRQTEKRRRQSLGRGVDANEAGAAAPAFRNFSATNMGGGTKCSRLPARRFQVGF